MVTVGLASDPDMICFLQDLDYRPSTVLGATLSGQEMSNWCWAATGRMIMRWHGVTVAQCDSANERLGRNNCCNVTGCPAPDNGNACNSTGWADVTFNNGGFLFSRPVGVTWAWTGGGHIIVANGVRIEADGSRIKAAGKALHTAKQQGDVAAIT